MATTGVHFAIFAQRHGQALISASAGAKTAHRIASYLSVAVRITFNPAGPNA